MFRGKNTVLRNRLLRCSLDVASSMGHLFHLNSVGVAALLCFMSKSLGIVNISIRIRILSRSVWVLTRPRSDAKSKFKMAIVQGLDLSTIQDDVANRPSRCYTYTVCYLSMIQSIVQVDNRLSRYDIDDTSIIVGGYR